ncbi:MAG TPA: hypothetical protein VF576_06490, partial [Rubricoccaceae bacterium]
RRRPPLVRHDSRLDTLALQKEAAALIKRKGLTQAEVAERIGAYQPHVGAALGKEHSERASILARIVDELSDFTAEREVVYRIRRKEAA